MQNQTNKKAKKTQPDKIPNLLFVGCAKVSDDYSISFLNMNKSMESLCVLVCVSFSGGVSVPCMVPKST